VTYTSNLCDPLHILEAATVILRPTRAVCAVHSTQPSPDYSGLLLVELNARMQLYVCLVGAAAYSLHGVCRIYRAPCSVQHTSSGLGQNSLCLDFENEKRFNRNRDAHKHASLNTQADCQLDAHQRTVEILDSQHS